MVTEGEKLGRRINSICNTVGSARKEERLACKIGAGRALKEASKRKHNVTRDALDTIEGSESELDWHLPKKREFFELGTIIRTD